MINKVNIENVLIKEIVERYIKVYFEDILKINLKEEGMIRFKVIENINEMIEII